MTITQCTLAEMRKQSNLTLNETAESCGIAPRTLQHWEKGEHIPDIVSILQLLALYKRSFIELDLRPYFRTKEQKIREKEKRKKKKVTKRTEPFRLNHLELTPLNGKGY